MPKLAANYWDELRPSAARRLEVAQPTPERTERRPARRARPQLRVQASRRAR